MNTQPYQGEEQDSQSSNHHRVTANSILVADCGSVFTKVSLLGIVEGQYRLMACGEAPTTVSAPHEDITQGVIQAINQIEFITGRRLVTDRRILSPEKPNGDGVDVFVATISAGGPIRLVVLGAVSAMLDTLAAQAMSGLYAETYALPAPSYVATSMPVPLAVGAGAAVGGSSGAPQYIEAVRRMLGGLAQVAHVDPLASPAQLGPISLATNTLYERNVMQYIPGYDWLRSWSNAAPLPTAASVSSLVRFLSQHYSMNVTTVDVGGATTSIMVAGEKGEFAPIVNSGMGIGSGVGAVFQKAGLQRLARWLPFEVSEDELRQYVLNRMLHPQVIPTNLREFQISQAFVREAILLTIEAGRYSNSGQIQPDLIVATGSAFARAPKYGQVVLMLLDTLQPRGVTSIVLDRTMLVPQLGAVATVAPVAAVQVNENDAVSHRLGTCIVPFGGIQPGQLAVRVGLEHGNGQQSTVEVIGGTIAVVPLRLNEQAALTLTPAPTVDVGLGPGERARAAEEIDGGLVGLIIDARGRPLSFASNETERRARLLQWMQALDA